ncbi:RBBP9/YdeN family alpha/beta hydrolase [Bartonella sp. DGB2]|uniref:RBBP9/YdeN family alpha/beta hydrolase n=1 Tax=Bartonella sp. DGB2 TaxID=3388426 RepID=UPI00398FF9B8
MKANQLDILIIPGYQGSDADHWQSRWQAKLSTAKRVEQADWDKPQRDIWVKTLQQTIQSAHRPILLIGHSLGVATIIHMLAKQFESASSSVANSFSKVPNIKGLFLVAPPDLDNPLLEPTLLRNFGAYPRQRLAVPSVLIASQNDPYCTFKAAQNLGKAWGSLVLDAGESGHINSESGHGPWPEGLLILSQFLARL